MKVVFGKTMLDKTYEKACQVAKENNNKPIEYVILNDLEFALCWSELPSCREVFSNVGMSEQNSTDDTKLFKYKDVYFIKQIPLDYAYIGMYEQILEKAKEYLND